MFIGEEKFNPLDPCPHPSFYEVGEKSITPAEVVDVLAPLLTQERLQKIEAILGNRTYQLTPVLENIYDSGNINAVVRTAESFGLQMYHIIPSVRIKTQNRVSRGAEKWTDGYVWANIENCLLSLKKAGYLIASTHLGSKSIAIHELPAHQKIALVIGNEHEGVSAEALGLSDLNVLIPTHGLTQSLNLSVASAVSLYEICRPRLQGIESTGNLSPEQIIRLKAAFLYQSLHSADLVLKRTFQAS